ncbi:sigma-54 interaction domain-containing protein [Cohnella sp.]|uniref:sigma-54 interaction domain-containing protein n=1 Tax=Cohnella sp. TaxID=1883426 RepID=UPI0035615B57
MFNFEQIYVDSSIILVKPDETLTDVYAKLQHNRFVIVNDAFAYIISCGESPYILLSDPDMSVKEWIARTGHIHSPVYSLSQLEDMEFTSDLPILIGESQSEIQGVVTTAAIITCLLKEKQQLSSYLHTMVETVNDAVTAVDQEGRVIFWNQAAEQIYGITKKEIIGRKIGDHFDKDSIMLHRILTEGRAVRQMYHQSAPNTHVLINASPIIDNNRIIGGIATEKDISRVVRLNEKLYSAIPASFEEDNPFTAFIGEEHAMKRVLELAQKFAWINKPVLLTGEAGSGKEMLAHAIHHQGGRKNGTFMSLHCGAIPGGLLETELFGYQGGAFTSQEDQGRPGRLELAAGGTLLLKDIDKVPLNIQLKLLQYLKIGSFERIGGGEAIHADTRIIASTTVPLRTLMEQGQFLEDLYYALNVMGIELPPLRERTEDIPEIVQAFVREFSFQYNKHIPKIDPEVMNALMNYVWPGNMRELRNIVERIVIVSDGGIITEEHLPQGLISEETLEVNMIEEDIPLKTRLSDQDENGIINDTLRKVYGNKSAAAKMLGISRGTLYKKMKEYGIEF